MAKLFGVKVICPERVFFEGEAEMLEMKKQEIANLHVQAGLTIGQKLLNRRK